MAVRIANLALQKLGVRRIASLDEDSKQAAAMQACYDMLRKGELRRNFWIFAIARTTLAASGTAPTWGRSYAYNLPPDFLRIASEDPRYTAIRTDYLVDGGQILTTQPGPLYLRYVRDVVNDNLFDPLFAEALSCRLALQTCEELTGSTSKLHDIGVLYDRFMGEARMVNAIEAGSDEPEEDPWILARA